MSRGRSGSGAEVSVILLQVCACTDFNYKTLRILVWKDINRGWPITSSSYLISAQ